MNNIIQYSGDTRDEAAQHYLWFTAQNYLSFAVQHYLSFAAQHYLLFAAQAFIGNLREFRDVQERNWTNYWATRAQMAESSFVQSMYCYVNDFPFVFIIIIVIIIFLFFNGS